MTTDYWPQEEGCVFDAEAYIIPCYPEATISEMSSVKAGASSTAGRIDVAASTGMGDGIGIALKAADSAGVPLAIPILFYGIAKCTTSGSGAYSTAHAGSFAMNSITTTYCGVIVDDYTDLQLFGGGSYVMGMWLHDATTVGDEGLLLVGKCI